MPPRRDFTAALRVLLQDMDRAVAWRLVVTVLVVVAGGLLAGMAPVALKGLIDAATGAPGPRDRPASVATLTLAAAYLAALCGGRLLIELRPSLIGVAEQRLYAQLRQRYFGHLLALPFEFHLGRRTGSLVHGLHQAISAYQVIVFNLVNGVVPVLVELVTVTLVLASLAQPALMVTFAATALAYLAFLGLRTSRLGEDARAVCDASIDAHGVLADSLLNVETIKCFGAERLVHTRFEKAVRVLENRWATLQRQRLHLGVGATATFAVSMTASLAIAVHAMAQGTLTTGGFVLANVYMLQMMRPLEMLGTAARDVSQALEFVRPLIAVFKELPETCQRDDRSAARCGARCAAPKGDHAASGPSGAIAKVTIGSKAPGIRFRGVHLAFDADTPVLHDLNLDIASARMVAIVGASGCGKSSLVRLLLRLFEPQAGSILLDGVPIDKLPLAELRSMIAVVPQDCVLFDATIAANIGIGSAGATQGEIERAARAAEVHGFIASLPAGYDTMVGERGLKLSGGERQRIAIARAVLKNPRVHVFDEATSMLDGPTEKAIVRNLQAISAGRTTITVAHRLSSVRHVDEIVVLGGGKVCEQGDHDTLLARGGAYAAMWRAQSGG